MEIPKYFFVERINGEINDTDYVCTDQELENWLRNIIGTVSLKKDISVYRIDPTPIPFKMTRPRIWFDGKELLPEEKK